MPTAVHRKPTLILLVLVAATGCLALGWWQWSTFRAAGGTFQNLGYALQWPLFAWFFVFAYRRFVRYEVKPPIPGRGGELTEIPPGLLPDRSPPAPKPTDDPVLAEYNAYLIDLADGSPDRGTIAHNARENGNSA